MNGYLVGLLGFKPMVRREQRRRSVRFRCTPAIFPELIFPELIFPELSFSELSFSELSFSRYSFSEFSSPLELSWNPNLAPLEIIIRDLFYKLRPLHHLVVLV